MMRLIVFLLSLAAAWQEAWDLGTLCAVGSSIQAVVIGGFGCSGNRSGANSIASAVRVAHTRPPFAFGLAACDCLY